jgi:hypothetical protein
MLHCGAFDPYKVLRAPQLFLGCDMQHYFSGQKLPGTGFS